jgi:hypothetical protein
LKFSFPASFIAHRGRVFTTHFDGLLDDFGYNTCLHHTFNREEPAMDNIEVASALLVGFLGLLVLIACAV